MNNFVWCFTYFCKVKPRFNAVGAGGSVSSWEETQRVHRHFLIRGMSFSAMKTETRLETSEVALAEGFGYAREIS